MPGKRFDYRITRGPWKGLRARIICNAATEGNYLLDVQGVKLPQAGIPSLRWTALRRIHNKPPRLKKGGKKP